LTPAPQSGLFGWVKPFKASRDEFILQHQSLDGYLFLRFIKLLGIISFVGCCITWPVLFPVNATGGGGEKELDLLSFSNVVNVNRYYAHALIAWVFLGTIIST
jgi:calcium permeable stress-gated cation channel